MHAKGPAEYEGEGGFRMSGEALFEHRFWLQILGDHARFIFNGLSSKEAEDVQKANRFIQWFDGLLAQSQVWDPIRI